MTQFFHGSPGTENDFSELKEYLDTNLHCKKLLISYSFGSVSALEIAQNDPQEAIVLISPFIFASRPSSLLKVPLLSDILVNTVGQKKLDLFFERSASPALPSQAYLEQKKALQSILKKSILEKRPVELGEREKKWDTPLLLIFGEFDRSINRDQIVSFLKNYFSNITVQIVPNGGHALTWTHPKLLAFWINDFLKQKVLPSQSDRLGYAEGASVKNNVYSFLTDHLKNHPERPLLKWANRASLMEWIKDSTLELKHDTASAMEIDQYSSRIAFGLKSLGLQKSDRVILFLPMSLPLYATMFALQKIGAIPVFLDSWARKGELGASAKIVDAKAMISVEQIFQLCHGEENVDKIPFKICFGDSAHPERYQARLESFFKADYLQEIEPVLQDETALITFTTGSSGTPKGARRTHRFLAAQHYALHRTLPYLVTDVDLPVFPIFSLNNMAEGVPTVIPSFDVGVPSKMDAAILIAQFKANNVTSTTLSPSLFNALSKHALMEEITLTNLRRVVTGGAPVSRDNLVDFKRIAPNAEIWVLYGSTEVEPIAHIEAINMIAHKGECPEDPNYVDNGVNVGHIDSGLEYKLISINPKPIIVKTNDDWKAIVVPPFEVGELIVSGEHVCREYFNDEEAVKRAKIFDHEGKVWHRTGDLARLDHDNNLWIVGRVHNAIARGGRYEFPVRAEIVMKRLPFTEKCAYLGMPDPQLGEKTLCIIAPKIKEKLNQPEILKIWEGELRTVMENNEIPVDEVHFVENIPMDPRHHSKVEYAVLKEQFKK